MQEGMQDPSRFVGMHFFNPVHRMPLVEVIRGKQSSDRAVAAVFALAKRIGKTPVVVQDSPGFLVNRLLAPYLNEAMYLLSEGAGISDLDSVLLEFGMPMGPVELIDEVGIDVGEKVAHVLFEAFGARMQPCPMTSAIVKSGRLGKKNGKGFYLYSDGGKSKSPDPEVESLMGPSGDKDPGRVSRQDMLDRCLLPMINEASRALSERVVGTAGEVDLGMIMGMGFPPFRGGLLRYADELGAREVVKRLRDFASRVSVRFEPSQALLEMAEAGKGFYSEFSESSE
jgi:3-hydroxyacyl-CoA dehydrogenase/enoyl-CoA hydratase/3-hydroxybutyryl-CoA epimerase